MCRRAVILGGAAVALVLATFEAVWANPTVGVVDIPAHRVERPCEYCHDMPAGTSHPVGVAPSMAVPPDLPLDASGRLACTTCHEVAPGGATKLRRAQDMERLCQACHASQRLSAGRLSHALLIGSAHGAAVRAAGVSGVAHDAESDSRSLQCLECHDGSVASSDGLMVGAAAAHAAKPAGASLGQTHPVGVMYNDRFSVGEFKPAASLERGVVRLIEGRVGCTSCHSPFSRREKLLVMSNRGSGLCLSCHRM